LAHPDYNICGSKGKIVGYKDKNLKVKITQPLKKIKNDKI